MDTSLDLTAAPRETLLAIIAQQQNTIAQLQRRIEALEGKAKPGGPKGMPGIKPKSGRQQTPREKGPRKPRPHGFARQRMTPTHRVEHVLDACLQCGTGLSGGWTQRTRQVIDLPVVPVQVTEHVFIARTCPVCEKRRVPKVDLGGVALGKQRLGINLLSLMAALREEGRLPFRTVQWYLSTVHQLRLSLGAIVRAIHQVARRPNRRWTGFWSASGAGRRDRLAGGLATHFQERYFLRRGHKEVVDEVLDEPSVGQRLLCRLSSLPGTEALLGPRGTSTTDPLPQRPAIAVIYSAAKSFAHPQARQRQRVQRNWSGNCWPSAVP